MKKKQLFIILGSLIIALIVVCFAFGLVNKNNGNETKNMTGNLPTPSSLRERVSDISYVGNGYAFVSIGTNWKLFDLKGNLILELPEDCAPKSKVVNGYFFAAHKIEGAGNQTYDEPDTVFKIDGTEPFEGCKINTYIGFTGKKINTSNYVYLVKTVTETKDFDGTHKEEHVYNLNENLKECSDDVSWKNIIDGSGKYSLTYRFMYYDFDDDYNPGFQVNPRETRYLDVYVKENNGYFTHMKDDEKLYEPIEGKLYKNYGSSTDVMAKINNKFYIVKEDGSKKEIDYIPNDYTISEFYDGYIDAISPENNHCLFDPNGNEIEFKR